MIGQFNRFHESIWGVTCHAKRRRNVFESLMVQAVDSDDGITKYISDVCPLFDLHLMHQHRPHVARIGMVQRAGQLIRDVRVQRPTEGNVHHLTAATNPEERFAVLCRSVDQFQFNRIPLWVHVIDARVRITSKMLKGNVTAA